MSIDLSCISISISSISISIKNDIWADSLYWIISTFLIINILFFKKYVKTTLFILFLVFFASAILSFYHFGIEQDIFSESNICGANNLEILIHSC